MISPSRGAVLSLGLAHFLAVSWFRLAVCAEARQPGFILQTVSFSFGPSVFIFLSSLSTFFRPSVLAVFQPSVFVLLAVGLHSRFRPSFFYPSVFILPTVILLTVCLHSSDRHSFDCMSPLFRPSILNLLTVILLTVCLHSSDRLLVVRSSIFILLIVLFSLY